MSLLREIACNFADVTNELVVNTLAVKGVDVEENVEVGGSLTVGGATTLDDHLTVNGSVSTLTMDAGATVTGLPLEPVDDTDAASKAYVDSRIVFVSTLPLSIEPDRVVVYTPAPHGTTYRGIVSGESSVLPAGTPWPVKQYKELTGSIVFGWDGVNAVFDATKWCNFQIAVNDLGGNATVTYSAAPLPTLSVWSGDEVLLNVHEIIEDVVPVLGLKPTPRMEASITPLSLNPTLVRAAFNKTGTTYDFQMQFSAPDGVSAPAWAMPVYFSFKLYMPR